MKKKIALISLVLIGFVFIFAGSAWAGRDYHRGHHYQKGHPHHDRHYFRNHNGWRHDRGRHFSPRYHDRGRHYGLRHRDRHPHPYRRTIEKHIYHHTSSDDSYADEDPYQVAGTLPEAGFSFTFGISGTR